MGPGFGTRVQVTLVVLLFLASLGAILFNTVSAFLPSEHETGVRSRLREAGRRMAASAGAGTDSHPDGPGDRGAREHALRDAARDALADLPGVEGGFYLVPDDRFVAYAFPTGGDAHRRPGGSDPPPLEAPYIRAQARQSADLPPGEVIDSARTVGPSRVAFLTAPVGPRRPAPLVAWVMVRVSGPEHAEARAGRYAASAAFALAGVVAALLLSWNLGRTLRRQRVEQERLRDELRRAEHLAALGRMLAGVAHEVRNPLAGIRSTVQLWERLADRARTPESMAAVVGAVDRLDDLVARLLQFSRADASERMPVDLDALVAEALSLVGAQAAAQGVALERDPAVAPAVVSGAASALRQVVLNLLVNALQAMPTGGRLRCATRRTTHGVELRVADTGGGVAPAAREKLFEPFFTTRPEGTGLGLALCREVALGHGGRVELEATGPTGSVFLVVLPAAS